MVVVAFLVVSFAIWGIGDIFRGFGRSAVAKVGSTEISAELFRTTYNDRIQRLSRQFGRALTPDQARAFGLDQQILSEMMREAALDERARQLGLGVSDAEINRRITSDRNFMGLRGFDRVVFEAVLRQNGYTEARYVQEQRRLIVRRQIAEAVSGGVVLPTTVMELANRYENERRSIAFLLLTRDQAGDIPEPSNDELATYFEANKTQFRAPEYRKVDLLVLTPSELAAKIEVSDADAAKRYEDNKQRFVVAERRELQQIVFPTEEEAKAALERLNNNELNFSWLATERNLQERDINLGKLARSEIVIKAVGDAAFALTEGQVSAPVPTRGGYALIRLASIEPQRTQTLEEVLPEIRREIALERARATLMERHDTIEDERAAGSTLLEIGQKLGVSSRTIEAMDRTGKNPQGEAIQDLPGGQDLLTGIFAAREGVETDAVQVPGGGYIWYEVGKITPARDRTLEEARADVIARWREDQIGVRLKAKAGELLEKIKAGTPIEQIATENNLAIQTAANLRRGRPGERVPSSVVEAAFSTPKDAVAVAEGDTPAERFIFRVTDISVPDLQSGTPESERIANALRTSVSDDLMRQYVAQLEKDLGVSVNPDALRRAVGGETN